jgi:NADH-quinone oxidoreductase subunit G
MVEQPRKAYLLWNLEPEYDHANPAATMRALAAADTVIAFSSFRNGALEYADAILPITPFTETSGTFVNCEGRAQSFNGTVKPLGEARPAWKVLRVLGNILGLPGFDYDTSESVRDEVLGAGVADVSSKLSNVSKVAPTAAAFGAGDKLERIADVPIYFADALVRRSAPLQATVDAQAPQAVISAALAGQIGVKTGDLVQVLQGNGSAILAARVDAGLPANVVRVSAAHASTATLGAMFGAISVAKAGENK